MSYSLDDLEINKLVRKYNIFKNAGNYQLALKTLNMYIFILLFMYIRKSFEFSVRDKLIT